MKKIGILTLQNTVNYGAVLQLSALQAVLESLGASCTTLNYSNHVVEARESSTRFSMKPRNLARYVMRHRFERRREDGFARFAREHLNLTEPLDRAGLFERAGGLDCLIVGSDQVWNPRVNGGDAVYFCAGMPRCVKRVSYAASLGGAGVDELLACDPGIADDLRAFSRVSVREGSSLPVLAQLGIDASWNPDPTFLLSADQWVQGYAAPAGESGRRYVLVYTLNAERELLGAAQRYAESRGADLVALHYNTQGFDGFKNVRSADPSEFLRLMRGAECVFTDSFHGTCFALNFGKEFYVRLSQKKVAGNARIRDLLEHYGIAGRYVVDGATPFSCPDYDAARRLLTRDRENALRYLSDSLELA